MKRFSSTTLASTPMAKPTPLADIANSVISQLNDRFRDLKIELNSKFPIDYATSGTTGSELIFGNVTFPDRKIHLLMHVRGAGGTYLIEELDNHKVSQPPAPFEISSIDVPAPIKAGDPIAPLKVEGSIDRLAADSIPGLLTNLGLDNTNANIRVTHVPDLVFVVNDGSDDWQVRYNSLKGTVSGIPISAVKPQPLSLCDFLTRLHKLHVYPDEGGSRWVWMLFVDVMAIAMIFWACSGICMWWQIRMPRAVGIGLLLISICISCSLALFLYRWLSQSA